MSAELLETVSASFHLGPGLRRDDRLSRTQLSLPNLRTAHLETWAMRTTGEILAASA